MVEEDPRWSGAAGQRKVRTASCLNMSPHGRHVEAATLPQDNSQSHTLDFSFICTVVEITCH